MSETYLPTLRQWRIKILCLPTPDKEERNEEVEGKEHTSPLMKDLPPLPSNGGSNVTMILHTKHIKMGR